ncbi:subclass B1 metallo-beta-lactamase [uncultured Fibrella sp.]|uniref:subclass B1 metallo-beta-lactamase n=1 Tax=uncultured Fibrella sp. TaxID=1284596 RepID=UPI0035CBCE95
MTRPYLFLSFVLVLVGCRSAKLADNSYTSPSLTIQQVSTHVYQHISYLETQTFGKVPCNGMIVVDKHEAIMFDTPANDSTSAELLNWIDNSLKCKVVAIIPTHFHDDCLGGLAEFHRRGIPSYAGNQTIWFAKQKNRVLPQHGFDTRLPLKVGNREVIAEFVGEGHTRDNIIGYFPSEKVMFGGCLIKELKAGKGNLEDANVPAWSATVTRLKAKYPDTQVVIPGHGKTGNTALLDYTIALFKQN